MADPLQNIQGWFTGLSWGTWGAIVGAVIIIIWLAVTVAQVYFNGEEFGKSLGAFPAWVIRSFLETLWPGIKKIGSQLVKWLTWQVVKVIFIILLVAFAIFGFDRMFLDSTLVDMITGN